MGSVRIGHNVRVMFEILQKHSGNVRDRFGNLRNLPLRLSSFYFVLSKGMMVLRR